MDVKQIRTNERETERVQLLQIALFHRGVATQ